MDGIHDLGGKHGFGAVDTKVDPKPFVERWQGAVFTMVRSLYGAGVAHNTDFFRHSVERIDPISYLSDGYYGRWLGAVESMLVEAGVITSQELTARAVQHGAGADDRIAARPYDTPLVFPADEAESSHATAVRPVSSQPKFIVGSTVRTRAAGVPGHTRLPAYARGVAGVVAAHHGGWVYPDTNAHAQGEQPQHLYTVEFSGDALWGEDGDANLSVCIDLFEPYLEEVV